MILLRLWFQATEGSLFVPLLGGLIFYAGIPLLQIRERLIAGNAPQKGSSTPRHIQWARSSIQGILESAKEYAYGYKEQSRDGETYQISVEPIIDIPTYELFKIKREKNKANSPHCCILKTNSPALKSRGMIVYESELECS